MRGWRAARSGMAHAAGTGRRSRFPWMFLLSNWAPVDPYQNKDYNSLQILWPYDDNAAAWAIYLTSRRSQKGTVRKHNLLFFFLLENSHTHSFMCYLWLLAPTMTEFSRYHRELWLAKPRYYYLTLLEKVCQSLSQRNIETQS